MKAEEPDTQPHAGDTIAQPNERDPKVVDGSPGKITLKQAINLVLSAERFDPGAHRHGQKQIWCVPARVDGLVRPRRSAFELRARRSGPRRFPAFFERRHQLVCGRQGCEPFDGRARAGRQGIRLAQVRVLGRFIKFICQSRNRIDSAGLRISSRISNVEGQKKANGIG
jgi:hypothetical protein